MDIKDVEGLAALARIQLAEGEKEELLSEMDRILGYVKQIEDLKIEGFDLQYDVSNSWREDELDKREFDKDLIISQFPDSQPARPDGRSGGDRFLKVKKIL